MFDIGKFYSDLSQIGKILFVVAFLFIFLTITDLLVFGPIWSQMKMMDAEVGAKKETIRRNVRILSFKDNILSEYQNFQTYLDTGEKSQEEIIGALLRKIEALAKQQSIAIASIRPGDVQSNPVFQEYKTTLECEGSLSDILNFMKQLEDSDYLFQITRYNLVPKSKSAEILKCEMDISRTLITAESKVPT